MTKQHKAIRWLRGIVLWAALFLLPWQVTLAETPALDNMINQVFRNHHTIGAAAVVAQDGVIIYEHYYGYANKKDKTPVTENTYFRLASVTKMVTAIRVMQLVEEGMLNLDEDISLYLGYKVRNPYHRGTLITLRMLMTHTSSLNPYGGYMDRNRSLSSLIAYDKAKKKNWYKKVPGQEYRYSNFGAGVIGSILEAVTEETLQNTVAEGVFDPLDMDAAYAACLLEHPDDVPVCYNKNGTVADSQEKSLGKEYSEIPDPDNDYRINVGSLWMRPTDLCRLGIMLCNGGTWGDTVILQPETIDLMMEEQQGQGGITAKTPYGLNLIHEKTLLTDRILYGHQGLSDGILCNLYFDPESRIVFVLCSNGTNNQMDNRVAHLTRRIFALVWSAVMDDTDKQAPETR